MPTATSIARRLANYQYQIAKLGKPVDKNEWWMTPQTVNAVNLPLQNALNFPAGDPRQGLSTTRSADAAANYGAIGSVIGHEISHSFDNLGADFDAERQAPQLVDSGRPRALQAGRRGAWPRNMTPMKRCPGLHLNGKQELGENIADVAGLAAAYDA